MTDWLNKNYCYIIVFTVTDTGLQISPASLWYFWVLCRKKDAKKAAQLRCWRWTMVEENTVYISFAVSNSSIIDYHTYSLFWHPVQLIINSRISLNHRVNYLIRWVLKQWPFTRVHELMVISCWIYPKTTLTIRYFLNIRFDQFHDVWRNILCGYALIK